jgi:hypothetical protein
VSVQPGDYKTAVPLLEQAAAELPGNSLVSYIATGQLATANKELKKAVELASDNDDLQAKIKAAEEKIAM